MTGSIYQASRDFDTPPDQLWSHRRGVSVRFTESVPEVLLSRTPLRQVDSQGWSSVAHFPSSWRYGLSSFRPRR